MPNALHTAHYRSPIGTLLIVGTEKGVEQVRMVEGKRTFPDPHPCLQACIEALKDYFSGKTRSFVGIGVSLIGTGFQIDVWQALTSIPYGETITYGGLAKVIGTPHAARAVGNALNKNPLMLLVPCHRVVPTNAVRGDVGGFAVGSEKKRWLLEHERRGSYACADASRVSSWRGSVA